MNDSKRPAETAGEGDGDGIIRPSKRARFDRAEPKGVEETTNDNHNQKYDFFIPTRSYNGRRFLRLHLQLLKTLYFEETGTSSEGGEDGTSVAEQDGPIDEELYQMIALFLRDRGGVRALDAKVQHYEGLYEGAIDFMREEEAKNHNTNNNGSNGFVANLSMSPWSLPTSRGNPNGGRQSVGNFMYGAPGALRSSSSLLFGGSQQSPFMPAIYPHYHHHHVPGSAEKNSINPFGLVAGLLQQKLHAALEDLQKTATPFEPLVMEVGQRIETLEKLATEGPMHDRSPQQEPARSTFLEDDSGDNHRSHSASGDSLIEAHLQNSNEDDDDDKKEEWLAIVDTKLRLWKLLHSDLVNQ